MNSITFPLALLVAVVGWQHAAAFGTDPSRPSGACQYPPPNEYGKYYTCTAGNGDDYWGNISITKTGAKCQNWGKPIPYAHNYHYLRAAGPDGNACRNPSIPTHSSAWCYTLKKWEECDIPKCPCVPTTPGPTAPPTPEPTTAEPTAEPTVEPTAAPTAEPTAAPTATPTPAPVECMYGNGHHYLGTVSMVTTVNLEGNPVDLHCLPWASRHNVKYPHLWDQGNACRNPDNDAGGPWCYRRYNMDDTIKDMGIEREGTRPEIVRQNCSSMIKQCDVDCYTYDGEDYKGTANTTTSNLTCQAWNVQTPQEHKYENVGEMNFCRNPSGHTAPWCYTTTPVVTGCVGILCYSTGTRWQECEVPKCAESKPDCRGEYVAGAIYSPARALPQRQSHDYYIANESPSGCHKMCRDMPECDTWMYLSNMGRRGLMRQQITIENGLRQCILAKGYRMATFTDVKGIWGGQICNKLDKTTTPVTPATTAAPTPTPGAVIPTTRRRGLMP